jgi:hypothetical protein
MKKLIYFIFLIAMFGGMIVLQSCGDTPIDAGASSDNKPINTTSSPNKYFATGIGFPKNCATGEKLPIYAGVGNSSGLLIGYAEFLSFTGNQAPYTLTVKLDFTNPGGVPWIAEDIHFHIANTADGIPVNNGGNPDLGSFYYHEAPEYNTNSHTIIYNNVPEDIGYGYYMALHIATCRYGETEGFEFYLPNEPINFNLLRDGAQNYYFRMKFSGISSGFLATYDPPGAAPVGTFFGWCIDNDNQIYPPLDICGKLYSSYENLPSEIIGSGMIDYPDNLDMVNYIINKYQKGSQVVKYNNNGSNVYPFNPLDFTPVGGSNGTATYKDIQNAIWSLMDNIPAPDTWENPKNPDVVWGIIYDALINGEGFTPQCGDKILAIIVPVSCDPPYSWNGKQIMVFEVPMPCETQCETAWADGLGARIGKQWGTYFRWNVNCPTP